MSITPRSRLQRISGHPRGDVAPLRVAPRRVRLRNLELERLEIRMVMSVTIAATNNGGSGYACLDFNGSGGYAPPDTNGAAGPSAYVETVNQVVALFPNKATG